MVTTLRRAGTTQLVEISRPVDHPSGPASALAPTSAHLPGLDSAERRQATITARSRRLIKPRHPRRPPGSGSAQPPSRWRHWGGPPGRLQAPADTAPADTAPAGTTPAGTALTSLNDFALRCAARMVAT